jgi:hypothetical protein
VATNAPALIYDPRYHTFESWASLMCEQYATQQLVIPSASTDWQQWGAGLLAIDVFTNEAAPNPFQFDDWHEWAEALVATVNPK